MTTNPTDVVLYVRVSSREQAVEGFSIEAQRRFLLQHAAVANLRIVAEFNDEETAKTPGRSGFTAMMTYLRAHPLVRTVIVEKTDRLLRNWKDFITIDDAAIDVVFVKEGTTFGPNSHSSQRFLQSIKVGMARHYSENLSEEVKKGLHEKCRLDGAWPAKAHIGYINCGAPYGIDP
ncbi:MAG TPA: recombinase family protein, partial [Thermoanaerobaculia bacterium]|nr:recombinase family protein [Thermoanaerobaculia bacterium]